MVGWSSGKSPSFILYSGDYIEDYTNEKLDKLLKEIFDENQIENFNIEDIKLQVSGNFIELTVYKSNRGLIKAYWFGHIPYQ